MNTRIEPIELTDDELKAVAGGGFVGVSNSSEVSVSNSFNDVDAIDVLVSNSLNNALNNSFNSV